VEGVARDLSRPRGGGKNSLFQVQNLFSKVVSMSGFKTGIQELFPDTGFKNRKRKARTNCKMKKLDEEMVTKREEDTRNRTFSTDK
jgi:hypothetical protein